MIPIKTAQQIEGIRKACRLAADALRHGGAIIRPGVSTADVNRAIYLYMKDNGGESATKGYRGYPAETCISLNDVVCHGIPSPTDIIKDGDLIKIDVTTILNGYYGDTCMTFPVGTQTKKKLRLVEDTRDCLSVGINQCAPGAHFARIGYSIGQLARSLGYGVVTAFCGHGVGLDFHEEPKVVHTEPKPNVGPIMRPGMTFTIEPMICMGTGKIKVDPVDQWTARTADGKLAAQFEHTILITATGHEVLTLPTK